MNNPASAARSPTPEAAEPWAEGGLVAAGGMNEHPTAAPATAPAQAGWAAEGGVTSVSMVDTVRGGCHSPSRIAEPDQEMGWTSLV